MRYYSCPFEVTHSLWGQQVVRWRDPTACLDWTNGVGFTLHLRPILVDHWCRSQHSISTVMSCVGGSSRCFNQTSPLSCFPDGWTEDALLCWHEGRSSLHCGPGAFYRGSGEWPGSQSSVHSVCYLNCWITSDCFLHHIITNLSPTYFSVSNFILSVVSGLPACSGAMYSCKS